MKLILLLALCVAVSLAAVTTKKDLTGLKIAAEYDIRSDYSAYFARSGDYVFQQKSGTSTVLQRCDKTSCEDYFTFPHSIGRILAFKGDIYVSTDGGNTFATQHVYKGSATQTVPGTLRNLAVAFPEITISQAVTDKVTASNFSTSIGIWFTVMDGKLMFEVYDDLTSGNYISWSLETHGIDELTDDDITFMEVDGGNNTNADWYTDMAAIYIDDNGTSKTIALRASEAVTGKTYKKASATENTYVLYKADGTTAIPKAAQTYLDVANKKLYVYHETSNTDRYMCVFTPDVSKDASYKYVGVCNDQTKIFASKLGGCKLGAGHLYCRENRKDCTSNLCQSDMFYAYKLQSTATVTEIASGNNVAAYPAFLTSFESNRYYYNYKNQAVTELEGDVFLYDIVIPGKYVKFGEDSALTVALSAFVALIAVVGVFLF